MSLIAVNGAAGRMGLHVMTVILERGHTIAAAFEREKSPHVGKKITTAIQGSFTAKDLDVNFEVVSQERLTRCDGVIDFSTPEATINLLQHVVDLNKPIVIGTTGFTEEQTVKIKKAAERIPIVFSPNMSVGVNVLFKLTELAAKTLRDSYDIEIFEAHHRLKKDAPSGTAKKLFEIIKTAVAQLENYRCVEGRSGIVGERSKDEIGMMVLRGGDIVGEHTVFFIGEGERLELTHRAMSRKNFAIGAVLALEYILHKSNGLYSMFDVLGF
ncbi:MAG: 4-hydroxy-tetrahydrodipicolinate reductase [Spirochaetes bacterium]|nr:4-hydroxy-tetrahydrodipicolinate reductase [Spirochaetota bacterium]